jgi:hypothetical protein
MRHRTPATRRKALAEHLGDGANLRFRGDSRKVWNRRTLVVAARSGEGPFTHPLQTSSIVQGEAAARRAHDLRPVQATEG